MFYAFTLLIFPTHNVSSVRPGIFLLFIIASLAARKNSAWWFSKCVEWVTAHLATTADWTLEGGSVTFPFLLNNWEEHGTCFLLPAFTFIAVSSGRWLALGFSSLVWQMRDKMCLCLIESLTNPVKEYVMVLWTSHRSAHRSIMMRVCTAISNELGKVRYSLVTWWHITRIVMWNVNLFIILCFPEN